jgi:hypothetical protein
MIKPEYINLDGDKATIGNGEELSARPRYRVEFFRDKRGKVVDVECLEDYEAPSESFHVLGFNGSETVELAIRHDEDSSMRAQENFVENCRKIGEPAIWPVAVTVLRRPIFRQFA